MKKLSICLFLSGILLVQPVYAQTNPVTLDTFQRVLNQVEKEYYKPVSRDALLQASLKGMLESLDPYSEYFTASEYKSFTDSIEGAFVGIGIIVNEHPQYIEVAQVYPGSPALAAGLQKGDLITTVNGVDLSAVSYKERIDRLLGEANTAVTIGFRRGNETFNRTIIRKRIEINPVEHRMLEGDIGYIKIYEFTTKSAQHFESALNDLQKQNAKRLILDLRDNPGGDIEAVLNISQWFVPKGTTLITVKYRTDQDAYPSKRDSIRLPLVVLVNENSASGSEMLAGIIKDNRAGTLVGTTTYGKGVAQATYDLSGGSAGGFKLTVAEFFTTAMVPIQNAGIKPDVAVTQPGTISSDQQANLAFIEEAAPVKIGKSGLNVMAVEQRLALLGYKLAADGVYDQGLADTLKQMSIDTDGSLTPKEAAVVQGMVLNAVQQAKEDVQLKRGLEILRTK